MGVAVHFTCPFQETPEFPSLAPSKFPEFEKADLLHFYAAVSFDSPQQIAAAPGGEAVAAGGGPKKFEHGEQGISV